MVNTAHDGAIRSPEYLVGLVRELAKPRGETEWVEFKVDNAKPEEIGEYISALSNAAALVGKPTAYMLWGIENETSEIVGTEFRPRARRVNNEELENWLLRQLSPKLQFSFHEVMIDGVIVVMLEVESAPHQPVQFSGVEFVRIGSYKQKLKQYPEKERELWRIFDRVPFEQALALEHVTDQTVFGLLDFPEYFDLTHRSIPRTEAAVVDAMAADGLIRPCPAGGWDVTNLGAMLFAVSLARFPKLRRKAMRVIVYADNSRLRATREEEIDLGYASAYEALIERVLAWSPTNEVIEKALRKSVPMYPPLALRELVANALIHQDFSITGAGPTIEIFSDRLEITNPGEPLVEVDRFLDTPPRSRNESLASLMRRFGICEERGSGIDRVVFEIEQAQLPAPLFEVTGGCTRAVLFGHRPLVRMDADDRIRACYLHACLRHVNRDFLTNASLRERFGIDERNKATASRLIKDAVEAGAIVPHDRDAGPRFMKYVPWWAMPHGGS